jgi:hypothetical protein
MGTSMMISDVTCSSCGASYEMAEATSPHGGPGQADCVICGALLESWQEPKLKAFRLVMVVEHRYAKVPPRPTA